MSSATLGATDDGPEAAIYEAAWRNAPPSVGMDILADFHGTFLLDLFDNLARELASDAPDLEQIASSLSEEVLRLADNWALAPFDGTLAELLDEGETEQDWLIRTDLLPFLRNWHRNVRAAGIELGIENDQS